MVSGGRGARLVAEAVGVAGEPSSGVLLGCGEGINAALDEPIGEGVPCCRVGVLITWQPISRGTMMNNKRFIGRYYNLQFLAANGLIPIIIPLNKGHIKSVNKTRSNTDF